MDKNIKQKDVDNEYVMVNKSRDKKKSTKKTFDGPRMSQLILQIDELEKNPVQKNKEYIIRQIQEGEMGIVADDYDETGQLDVKKWRDRNQ